MDRKSIALFVRRALAEDKCGNDVTTNILVDKNSRGKAVIIVKEDCVVCGLEFVREVFQSLDKNIRISAKAKDGQKMRKGQKLVILTGRTRALLTGERTALNFLGYLSGIATLTNCFVKSVSPCQTSIMDTRKTKPTLRALEKYAVLCGGGKNHRLDLSDMVMIKDNHRNAFSASLNLFEAVKLARKKTKKKIQVEVDTLKQLREVLPAQPEMVLLDNMNIKTLRKAATILRQTKYKRPLSEASGNIDLKNVRRIAACGVDRISVGALTHSAVNIDFSMDIQLL